VRSDKEIEAVILMRIAEDLKIAALMLLVSLTYLIALPIGIYTLHLPREMLDALLISSQIAVATGTILLAFMTIRSLEELKVERLRESFKAIARELRGAKDYVEMELEYIREMLEAHKVVLSLHRILLGSSTTPKNVIRKDFELHYRRGLKLLEHIEKCDSKIEKYNEKYDEFEDWLKRSIVEKLEKMGIRVDPIGYTYVCARLVNNEWRILLSVDPKECGKEFLKEFRVLRIDDHVRAVLVGLDKVLSVHKSEEELSKELTSLYREIRASDEFRKYLGDLKSMVESEVKPCLEELRDELDKVIDDIMRRYALSEQEVAAKKD